MGNSGGVVLPNRALAGTAAPSGGGGGPMVVQVMLDGRVLAQSMIRHANADTRANGGRSRLKNTPYYADLR